MRFSVRKSHLRVSRRARSCTPATTWSSTPAPPVREPTAINGIKTTRRLLGRRPLRSPWAVRRRATAESTPLRFSTVEAMPPARGRRSLSAPICRGTTRRGSANLSTRAVVGTGGDILIPGIALSGSGKKKLIVRVSGPALTAAGVSGALARPQLRLFNGPSEIASNTGWSSGSGANTTALLSAFGQAGCRRSPPAGGLRAARGCRSGRLHGDDQWNGQHDGRGARRSLRTRGEHSAARRHFLSGAGGHGRGCPHSGITMPAPARKKLSSVRVSPALVAQGVGFFPKPRAGGF